ncbi:uncharacterized protein Hap1MRO34_012708 [Clarias gariepinus]|uniref:uncharacterized protein si:ch211-127m7.2 n=1 Tax=Clarias gariepinus TaxID=13013 RepID=UPI00234C2E63|nr:uncharacterized protein si:ch211-127m7.2 [Clarias gariepinus]
MSAKRNLPAWMVASGPKRGKEEKLRECVKSNPEVNTNKRGGKKCTKRMMYWMNEQELVETALSVLQRDNRKPAAANRCALPNPERMVIPETDPEDTSDSDISEPAVDIAEQQTVPYTRCFEEKQSSTASESSAEQPPASSAVLEKKPESEEDNSPQSNSDHEALQVVRDIFFS